MRHLLCAVVVVIGCVVQAQTNWTVKILRDGLTLQNETASIWSDCRIRITAGDYAVSVAQLRRYEAVSIDFDKFTNASGQPVTAGEGPSRAHHGVVVSCLGPNGQRAEHAFTF